MGRNPGLGWSVTCQSHPPTTPLPLARPPARAPHMFRNVHVFQVGEV